LKASIESAVTVLKLNPSDYDQIIVHAREASPHECCGLIGGTNDGQAQSIYRTRNIAADPLVAYEAAPEDLFAAQRLMRQRGEELLAIYHSHPRSSDPQPSATDVRLAYYPAAVYLIVGFRNSEPCARAFRLIESEARWEPADYEILDDESPKMS
jgi:[CysO sulfur-carrier protein]-S-L-cysteine hydrolase